MCSGSAWCVKAKQQKGHRRRQARRAACACARACAQAQQNAAGMFSRGGCARASRAAAGNSTRAAFRCGAVSRRREAEAAWRRRCAQSARRGSVKNAYAFCFGGGVGRRVAPAHAVQRVRKAAPQACRTARQSPSSARKDATLEVQVRSAEVRRASPRGAPQCAPRGSSNRRRGV